MRERVGANALGFRGPESPELAGYWRELAPRRIAFPSALLGDDLTPPRTILAPCG